MERPLSPISLGFDAGPRFDLLSELGRGGAGVVYRALDRELGIEVALKTIRHREVRELRNLKAEFRGLAEVVHPSLVRLYGLYAHPERWFFTMALVDGLTIDHWVRPEGVLDTSRLYPVVRALVQAVHALHGLGLIHRDLKPPNIMVEHAAPHRLVLLDFGLTERISGEGFSPGSSAGTFAYMAPEQFEEQHTRASDLYAVGAIIYELLVGRPPFTGNPLSIMMKKRGAPAPLVLADAPDAPADLAALADALLTRDPDERPDGLFILDQLGAAPLETCVPTRLGQHDLALVGRERELKILRGQLDLLRPESPPRMLHLLGRSGMGKSALMQTFLRTVEDDAWVLRGRCYERESVPYKALDQLIDGLTDRLMALTPQARAVMLPPQLPALVRLFPVLDQLPEMQDWPTDETAEPAVLRQRGFAALKLLLASMSEVRPLILHIDDLQWGDRESVALLESILSPPAPPLLLVLSFRAEDATLGGFLGPMNEAIARIAGDLQLVQLEVGPLPEGPASALCRRTMGDGADEPTVDAILAEAGGNPFLIEALARHATFQPEGQLSGLNVRQMVHAQLEGLSPEATRLLQIVSLTGQPLARSMALEMAGVGERVADVLSRLRADHLLRVRTTAHDEDLEPYHDKIRAAIVADLPEALKIELHRDLALTFEVCGDVEPAQLAHHFEGAGRLLEASEYTVKAATQASAVLAFDRAAALIDDALALLERSDEPTALRRQRRHAYLAQKGEALVYAGRGIDASEALLAAASYAPPAQVLQLERKAAEQLMFSGRIDEGLATMRTVLAHFNLKVPNGPILALPGLLWHRARFNLRGTAFKRRTADEIPQADLERIDTCWGIALGLGLVDHVRAAHLHYRALVLTLEAGEPARVARTLALEAAYAAAKGPHKGAEARSEALVAQARAIAKDLDSPHAMAMADYGLAVGRFCCGRWDTVVPPARACVHSLRTQCPGAHWELATVEAFLYSALALNGQLRTLAAEVPGRLAEAQALGNLYHATQLRSGFVNQAWLVGDDHPTALAHVEAAEREWPNHTFQMQQYYHLVARSHLDLYVGDVARAHQRFEESWTPLRRSMLQELDMVWVDTTAMRGRLAAGMFAAGGDGHAEAGRRAAHVLKKLVQHQTPWGLPHAAMLRARLAPASSEAQVLSLREALSGYEMTAMASHAEAARARLGEAIGGDEGTALVVTAHDALRNLGVVAPARWVQMLAP